MDKPESKQRSRSRTDTQQQGPAPLPAPLRGPALADPAEPQPADGGGGGGEAGGTFDYSRLSLSSPLAEFEAYARQKVKAAERLGRREDVEVYLDAFELGRTLLARKPQETEVEK